jgi:hypothetical protein
MRVVAVSQEGGSLLCETQTHRPPMFHLERPGQPLAVSSLARCTGESLCDGENPESREWD